MIDIDKILAHWGWPGGRLVAWAYMFGAAREGDTRRVQAHIHPLMTETFGPEPRKRGAYRRRT